MRKLPNRLQCIAESIKNGSSVADIGTDHGLLPVYLVKTDKVRRIIASDISEGSLYAARSLAAKHNLTDKIEIIRASGLSHLTATDVDTIVIAGVGGETIINILSDSPWFKEAILSGSLSLILQPQTKINLLFEYLISCGLTVTKEITARDRGREYKILLI